MNSPHSVPATRPLPLKPKWIAAGLFLLVVYLLLRPWLMERYGWDLPGLTDVKPKPGASAPDGSADKQSRGSKNRPVDVPVVLEQEEPEPHADKPVASSGRRPSSGTATINEPQVAPSDPATVKPAGKPAAPSATPTVNTSKPKSSASSAKPPATASKSEWKGLKSISRGKFESPAGLVYDQYRIDHVMEHTRDNTDKPSHGVFESTTQDEVLSLIDEAFELTKKRGPPQVVTEDEGDRTAYTVNLNRQVGRAGGQSGARRRNPPLQKIKIVVEETRVITAYPTN